MSLAPTRRVALGSWGLPARGECVAARPECEAEAVELATALAGPDVLFRGLGRSYGDAPLNVGGGVVLTERLDRLLSFDEENGLLTCEAGVSLGEVTEVLLPRGRVLPVLPGTGRVSVGGAIAADVHGKGHHRDGSFARCVEGLRLLTADGRIRWCSRRDDADLFRATLGGMGLTGAILGARLRLERTGTAWVRAEARAADDLDEALVRLAEADASRRWTVAWLDALAGTGALGRGVVLSGRPAARDELPTRLRSTPLRGQRRRAWTVPPAAVLHPWLGRAHNRWYRRRRLAASGGLVDLAAFHHPLDGILGWNRLYGRHGLVQWQVVFPPTDSEAGVRRSLELVRASGVPCYLAVLKTLGEEGEGLLSFPRPGLTLALDLPWSATGLPGLLDRLLGVAAELGARPYLAKDASAQGSLVAATYPRLADFRRIRDAEDPAGRWSSTLGRRLGLVAPRPSDGGSTS